MTIHFDLAPLHSAPKALALLILLGLATPAGADEAKQARKDLEAGLREMYSVSKIVMFNPRSVDRPGGAYVVRADGIQSEVMLQSGTAPTYIVEGQVKTSSDKGAGRFLGTLLTGRAREEARVMKKGERVYVTGIKAFENGLAVDLVTIDTYPIIDQGRTRQVAYKATMLFQNAAGKFPDVQDAAGLRTLVDRFVVDEAEATAPKTIELNQTTAQVEEALGRPDKVVKLGSRTIYSYKDLKVVFTDGKVSDVQ